MTMNQLEIARQIELERQRVAEAARQKEAEAARQRAAAEAQKRTQDAQEAAAEAIRKRIAELERQARQAQEMAEGKGLPQFGYRGAWMLEQMPKPEELKKESTSAKAKAVILTNYLEQQRRIAQAEKRAESGEWIVKQETIDNAKEELAQQEPAIKAITSKELAPYIEVNEDGSYYIDKANIYAALNAGIDEDLLRKVASGSKVAIQKIMVKRETPPVSTTARQVAAQQFVNQQAVKRWEWAVKKISKYEVEGGHDLAQAIADGTNIHVLKAAGFTQDQITSQKPYVEYMTASPEVKFAILQKWGAIPEKAKFESMDKEGNFTYSMPPPTNQEILASSEAQTLKDEFLNQDAGTQRTIIRQAMGYIPNVEYEEPKKTTREWFYGASKERMAGYFNALPDEQKLKVLGEWGKLTGEEKFLGFIPLTKKGELFVKSPGMQLTIGLVPVVGTIETWDKMSTPWKVVSVAADVFMLSSFLGVPSKIGLFIKGAKQSDALTDAARIINQGKTEAINTLKQIDPDLVKPYKKMITTQSKFADDYARFSNLEKTIETYKSVSELPGEYGKLAARMRAEAEIVMEAARNRLIKSQALFKSSIDDYVNAAKRSGIGFDDTKAAEVINSLPDKMVNDTKSLVNSLANPRNIQDIQSDLATAQRALNEARMKYPTDPSKWTDLAQDVSKYEAELIVRQTGDVAQAYADLIRLRTQVIPELESRLKDARAINSPYADDIAETLKVARQRAEALPKQIDDAIKMMEVEWGRGGWLGRGRAPVKTSIPLKPVLGGGSGISTREAAAIAETIASTGRARQLARRISQEDAIKPLTSPYQPQVWPLTPERAIPEKGKEPQRVPYEAPSIGPEPSGQIKVGARTITQPAEEAITIQQERAGVASVSETAPEPQTKPEQVTKPTTETITETTAKIRQMPGYLGLPYGKKQQMTDKEKRQVILDAPGAVAWPQGELNKKKVWHVVVEPYSQATHYVVMGKQPAGAEFYPGPREAYKSITQISGKPPSKPTKLEGGAVDPVISPSQSGRGVEIKFVKDTNVTRRAGIPKVKEFPTGLASDVVVTKRGGKTKRHIKVY